MLGLVVCSLSFGINIQLIVLICKLYLKFKSIVLFEENEPLSILCLLLHDRDGSVVVLNIMYITSMYMIFLVL